MKKFLMISVLILSTCSSGDAERSYKAPSLSGDVSRMSSETLCYRAETSGDVSLKDEINARGIDCRDIFESRAPEGDYRFDN